MDNYENRVVLFLDILGFKNIIDKTYNSSTDEDIPTNISELYDVLLSMTEDFAIDKTKTSKIVTQFSDSIVISFKEDEKEGIFILFKEIQNLIIKLLSKRIICRGAISYGKLIHNREIFGPALVDAYETETKAAMYPRVILDRSIVEIGKTYRSYNDKTFDDETAKNILEYLTTENLSKDTDDKYYIDYFLAVVRKTDDFGLIKRHIENLKFIILNGLKHKSPDLKVKYGWMKNKYNNMVDYFKQIGISDLKIIGNRELHNYLSKLNSLN